MTWDARPLMSVLNKEHHAWSWVWSTPLATRFHYICGSTWTGRSVGLYRVWLICKAIAVYMINGCARFNTQSRNSIFAQGDVLRLIKMLLKHAHTHTHIYSLLPDKCLRNLWHNLCNTSNLAQGNLWLHWACQWLNLFRVGHWLSWLHFASCNSRMMSRSEPHTLAAS